jgi:tetratricopeptide (TPR) repeat protein
VVALASVQQGWFGLLGDASLTMEALLALAIDAKRTLTELGDTRGAMRASWFEENVLFWQGRLDEASDVARARLEQATALGDIGEIRDAAIAVAGNLYWGSGTATEILAETDRAMLIVADSPTASARLALRRPTAFAMLGRFEQAHDAADEARQLLDQIANPLSNGTASHFLYGWRLLAGELAEAEREQREGAAILESLGEKGFLCSTLAALAEVIARQGRYDEAEEMVGRARLLAVEDDLFVNIRSGATMASVLASRGSLEEAERLAREAVELAEPTGYLAERADMWARLGEVLRMAGNTAGAREAFEQALALYERKENLVAAERVRQELAALSTPSS